MRKLLCALVVCIGLSWAAEPCPGQWGSSRVAGPVARQACETPHPAVARIWVRSKGTAEKSVGTAVLIFKRGKTAVVGTAQHLFRNKRKPVEVFLEFPNGQILKGTSVVEDADSDLAAVVLPAPFAEPIAICLDYPKIGEQITVAGYGQDGCYKTTAGTVKGPKRRLDGVACWIEMTGGSRQGDSGGPMLNSSGQLLGILWGTTGTTSVGTFNGRICQFLETQRFVLPWNADVAIEKERSRQPQLVPVQPQVLPGPAVDTEARQMARDALSRVAALEQSVTASVAGASSAAVQAAEVADKAVAGIASIESSVLEKAKEASKSLVFGVLQKVGIGGGLGLGVLALFAFRFFKKDRREYKTGEDPSIFQTVAQWTPWTWDDGLGNIITRVVYGPPERPPADAPAHARPGVPAPDPLVQANATIIAQQAELAALKAKGEVK